MKNFYKRLIYKNGYILIIAAWFYTLSFVVGNYFNYNNTPLEVKSTLEKFLHVQEKGFENLTNNLSVFTTLVDEHADKSALNLYNSPSGIYIYKMLKDSSLKHIFWSRFDMEVFPEELNYRDGSYFVEHTNGSYELIKKTIRLDSNTFIAAGMIPVKSKYFFENKYLKNTFIADKNISKYYDISAGGGIPVVNSKGEKLFYIDKIDPDAKPRMPLSEGILKAIAVIFCLLFLNYFILDVTERKGFKTGFLLLVASLLILRGFSYFVPFPFFFRQFELFNPAIYASSALHPSLGALMINSLLTLWITKFIRYRYDYNLYTEGDRKKNLILSYVFFTGFIIFSFFVFSIIRSLVVDSGIPFNVINFFELNKYTAAAFFIVSVLILIYYNLTYILMQPANQMGIPLWQKLAIASTLSIIILFGFTNTISIYVQLGMMVWLIGYIIFVHYKINDFESRLIRSPYFLFWVIFFSFSTTFLLKESDVLEEKKVKNIAENLSYKSINTDQNLLTLSIEELNTFFHKKDFYRFKDSLQNRFIKDSLYVNNFSAYLNNFDIGIYTFNSAVEPLFNNNDLSKAELDSVISKSLEISVRDLFYNESDSGTNAFIYRNEFVSNDKDSAGYLYLTITPKEYMDNNLYLQLLAETDNMETLANNYYIAIYKNRRIVHESTDYDFPDTIDPSPFPVEELVVVSDFNGNQYWYNAGNNKMIVIVKRNGVLFEFIAMFSYLLGFCMVSILLINLLYFLIESRFRKKAIVQKVQLSMRTQVYTAIIFVSLFSFVLIGGSTISFFILNFEKENVNRLHSVINRFIKEIEFDARIIFGLDKPVPSQEEFNEFITAEIMRMASVSNENINYYDTSGKIVTTSQPYIYNRKILSSQMHPVAYNQMRVNFKKDFYQNEQIGSFRFLSGYAPLQLRGVDMGYLNIPFLNSQSQLNKNISSFITIIIILTALVFLLAGVLSVFLTQRILNSFSVLKDRMKMINIGKENEEVYWEKNDELGALINEYNRMVRKLDASVQQLAKTEREGAWQEMARQVAHEIKNPLTPMKLNLQFLQRLVDIGDESSKELSKKIADSLIEQIDQLALIAGDFGQFANIGNVRLEEFHISEVLDSLVKMYSVESDYEIVYKKSGKDLIYFDKSQTTRLFTNLIKNAIEASSAEENNSIEIIMQDYGENVVVSVHDYGMGIDEEKAKRIFVPNFTTKSSGTGLGLAISKGIVENAKGRIWFESIPRVGTTFYVSLPLVKQ